MIILDIETTGLDPTNEVMLELAMLHISDDLERVLGEFQTLVRFDGEFDLVGTVVLNMHTKSGLWDELASPLPPTLNFAEGRAHEWLDLQETHYGIDVKNEPMAGSTVGFDRGFLKVHMPSLEARFFYRSIDVSSVKELVKRWRAPVYQLLPDGRKLHRALPDCYDTLNELRFYKARVLDYLTSPYSPIEGP